MDGQGVTRLTPKEHLDAIDELAAKIAMKTLGLTREEYDTWRALEMAKLDEQKRMRGSDGEL